MKALSRRISVQHLWALVILGGIFIFVNTHPIRPHDFWWHIAIGRDILATGQIPQIDTFSYTAAGVPYPSYQMFWLMEVILYTIYSIGGPPLIVFFQTLVVTCAYLFVFLTGMHVTSNWRFSAFGLMFAAALGLNDWNVRPQVITFLLGASFLYLVRRIRTGWKREWVILFPFGMILWVNSHGTFPIGLLIIGLWLSDELWISIKARWIDKTPVGKENLVLSTVTLFVSIISCLINPRGFGTWQYLREIGANRVIQDLVVEWAPPNITTLGGGLFFTALLLTALIFAVSPRRPTFMQLNAFLAFALLGLYTSRGVVWYGLVMGPISADHGSAVAVSLRQYIPIGGTGSGSHRLPWIFVGFITAAMIISLPWFKPWLPLPAEKAGLISVETPVKATDYLLSTHLPKNLFHAMSFGSYLIWAAEPEYPVFVDGRIELYSEAVWRDYLQISAAVEGWDERLQAYGIHTLMLSQTEQPRLVTAVMESGEWKLAYEDEAALIFTTR